MDTSGSYSVGERQYQFNEGALDAEDKSQKTAEEAIDRVLIIENGGAQINEGALEKEHTSSRSDGDALSNTYGPLNMNLHMILMSVANGWIEDADFEETLGMKKSEFMDLIGISDESGMQDILKLNKDERTEKLADLDKRLQETLSNDDDGLTRSEALAEKIIEQVGPEEFLYHHRNGFSTYNGQGTAFAVGNDNSQTSKASDKGNDTYTKAVLEGNYDDLFNINDREEDGSVDEEDDNYLAPWQREKKAA